MALRTGPTRVVATIVVGMMWLVLGGVVVAVVGFVGLGVFSYGD